MAKNLCLKLEPADEIAVFDVNSAAGPKLLSDVGSAPGKIDVVSKIRVVGDAADAVQGSVSHIYEALHVFSSLNLMSNLLFYR